MLGTGLVRKQYLFWLRDTTDEAAVSESPLKTKVVFEQLDGACAADDDGVGGFGTRLLGDEYPSLSESPDEKRGRWKF